MLQAGLARWSAAWRPSDLSWAIALLLSAVQVIATAGLLLRAPLLHDASIMAYLGYLVDRHHLVPYRDFFDVNLPVTYWAFAAFGRATGYSDHGLRWVDLGLLLATCGLTAHALRPFGFRPAAIAAALFALAYVGLAEHHALQREFLLLLALAGGMAVLSPATGWAPLQKAIVSGLCLGAAVSIKPGAGLDGLPWAVYLAFAAGPRSRVAERAAVVLTFALASLVPVALVVSWLVLNSAWQPFLEMASQYWPLHARLGALHEVVPDRDRARYLIEGVLVLGGHRLWFLSAAASMLVALGHPGRARPARDFLLLIVAVLMAHLAYPAVSGQFWPYHWLPGIWALAVTSALCWEVLPSTTMPWRRRLAIGACVAVLVLHLSPPPALGRSLSGLPPADRMHRRVEEIATYLRAHVGEGDTVQPLDWTGGAVTAMLRSRARLATPFVYDYHFYHHVDAPYTRVLRERLIAALFRASPSVIIQVETDKPWVTGPGTTRDFPELAWFLASWYVVDFRGDGYILYRRRPA